MRVGEKRGGGEGGRVFTLLIFCLPPLPPHLFSLPSLSTLFLSLLPFLSLLSCVQLQEKLMELSSLATDQQNSSELKKETEQLRKKLTSESKTVAELTKTNKALKQVHCLGYIHDHLDMHMISLTCT